MPGFDPKPPAFFPPSPPEGRRRGFKRALYMLYLIIKFFSVIPVKTGIHELLRYSWIPGLRYAAPGMTGIQTVGRKKLDLGFIINKSRKIHTF